MNLKSVQEFINSQEATEALFDSILKNMYAGKNGINSQDAETGKKERG